MQISVVDAGGVGDVVETFPVASDTITCIASVPEFDEQDPEVLASECTVVSYSNYMCIVCTNTVMPTYVRYLSPVTYLCFYAELPSRHSRDRCVVAHRIPSAECGPLEDYV